MLLLLDQLVEVILLLLWSHRLHVLEKVLDNLLVVVGSSLLLLLHLLLLDLLLLDLLLLSNYLLLLDFLLFFLLFLDLLLSSKSVKKTKGDVTS